MPKGHVVGDVLRSPVRKPAAPNREVLPSCHRARSTQGRVAALRISFNRLGGALVPLAMGALAEVIGLEAAFYVIGAAGLVLVALLAVWVASAPAFGQSR